MSVIKNCISANESEIQMYKMNLSIRFLIQAIVMLILLSGCNSKMNNNSGEDLHYCFAFFVNDSSEFPYYLDSKINYSQI